MPVPPGVVTDTTADPAAPAGDVTVIDVAVLAVIVPAVPPNVTAEAEPKFAPVIVTLVPPAVVPEVGARDEIDGG